MSKEKKFRKILKSQNIEEKQRVWENIQAELNIDLTPPVKSRKFYVPWKVVSVALSIVLVFGIGLGVFLNLFPLNQEGGRYCTSSDYVVSDTNETIKDIGTRKNLDLLYFNWYDETDYLLDKIYKLKNSNEEICYYEEIVDVNTGCLISIFVLDNHTKLDLLVLDDDTKHSENLKDITVRWKFNEARACANFEYKGYRYYLRADEPFSDTYILDLISDLLP